MNLSKLEFMREQLSDLSDSAVIAIYDELLNGYCTEVGMTLDEECGQAVIDHHLDNLDREDDEVERRLQREIDEEAA